MCDGRDDVAETRELTRSFGLHQFVVLCVFHEGDNTANARFSIDETPGKAADCHATSVEKVDVATEAFGMDDAAVEHLDVHDLVLGVVEDIFEAFAILLAEMRIAFFGEAGHPTADGRVEGMVCATAVNADPSDLTTFRPFREFAVWPRMLNHVADFVGGRLVPSVLVIAGVDDQDIAVVDVGAVFDHLGGIDVIVAGGVGEVNHDARSDEEIEGQAGNVASWGIEMNLAVEVRAYVIGMCQELAIGTIGGETFEILELQRLIRWPGGRTNANRDRQIN